MKRLLAGALDVINAEEQERDELTALSVRDFVTTPGDRTVRVHLAGRERQ